MSELGRDVKRKAVNSARRRTELSDQRVEGGALPCAIRAKKPEHLAFADPKAKVFDGNQVTPPVGTKNGYHSNEELM